MNPVTNEVFLRVWTEDLEGAAEGERVHLCDLDWSGTSSGYPERKRHIDALRGGAQGYGVVCAKGKPGSGGTARIKSFDREALLRLGSVHEDGRRLYSQVADRVPVNTLARRQTAESTLIPDLAALLKKGTTTEALVKTRVGQGQFRTDVLDLWGGRCCVTGIETQEAIRASHIKPWKDSTDEERLDPHNGLPLAGTLDGLFDSGLITFAPDGTLLVSRKLSVEERERLGIEGAKLLRAPAGRTADYLAHHRQEMFVDRPRPNRTAP